MVTFWAVLGSKDPKSIDELIICMDTVAGIVTDIVPLPVIAIATSVVGYETITRTTRATNGKIERRLIRVLVTKE